MLIDFPSYDYSYNKRFYDYKYNFSVNTKYEFLLFHNPKRINEKILLKEADPVKYYNELENELIEKDLFNRILKKIKNHHILVKREEIFEILYELYKSSKYQSFINLAVIQVEGLFYDFCLIESIS